ncbi:protein dispatched [Schistocerca gregaria]|uniref:protein dispatched n=1 Tax=Schistocerca gregaria TaxID=7010 RepID=UPI00211DAE45|nr:protein dispatched [Schistocerca gregaria]
MERMNWFARIIAYHPYVILIGVAVFAATCIVIPVTTRKPPDFSDPTSGFQSRGTVLSQRITAWINLKDATRPSGPLSVNPKGDTADLREISKIRRHRQHHKGQKVNRTEINRNVIAKVIYSADESTYNANEIPDKLEDTGKISAVYSVFVQNEHQIETEPPVEDEWETLTHLGEDPKRHGSGSDHKNHVHLASDGFFCSAPNIEFSRVVLSSLGESGLFNWESILSMCRIEKRLTEGEEYEKLCEKVSDEKCCPAWSLGNYIALLHNKSSCFNITENDVNLTLALLQYCAPYFYNLMLTPECTEERNEICQQVPPQCSQHNAVYNILYYLVDASFLPPNKSVSTLDNAMLILPFGRSSDTLDYYRKIDSASLQYQDIKVTAMELGLKNTLFDMYLVQDTYLVGAGALFVLLCMWAYTHSLFVTFMTVVAILFSLGISYFVYTLVFELEFFPFMNILASVVAVGIGADDAFIFCKMWQCIKAERNSWTVVKLMEEALSNAALSMFVTSLTTAAAFYTSCVSYITAIRCFSIFAGTATLANFGMMVTWLPASVVVSEYWCCRSRFPFRWLRSENVCSCGGRFLSFDKLVVTVVLKFKYMWLTMLGILALISVVIVFWWPRFSLPDTRDFQLFDSSHPFEQYELYYSEKFLFERINKVGINTKLPLRFVWGILPVDNGDYLNPASLGNLVFDPTFDIGAPESQVWLLEFCRNLRAQQFYQSTRGPLLPNCFIESFISWMQRRCQDPISHIDRTPCCETEQFPYVREVFELCIVHAIKSLYETPVEILMPGMAGPKFSADPGKQHKIQAVVVEYDSVHSFSLSFSEMNKFFNEVESWMQEQLATAPPGMENGWFVSDLDFYDLQLTLSNGTLVAIVVSMAISLSVILFVTLNLLVSLYAVITVTAIISVTVSSLVIMGWKLNILESVAVTVAIGLAVDFSLHYGVHYRMCPDAKDRVSAVSFALSRMSGPTAMAALTTAAAGAFMLPSSVLAYIQIGIFLVAVMIVSWVYSTFFFGSLLAVCGPQHGFGQFSYSDMWKFCSKIWRPVNTKSDDGVSEPSNTGAPSYNNMLSESTLSTSSTAAQIHVSISESHELEALSTHIHQLHRSGSLSAVSVPLIPKVITRQISLPAEQSALTTNTNDENQVEQSHSRY